jgi:cold shock CspA family protein
MLRALGIGVKGTIKGLAPTGHGIIHADDGSKVPFLFVDVLSRRALAVGQRVTFSVRRIQKNIFAENITHEAAERAAQPHSK